MAIAKAKLGERLAGLKLQGINPVVMVRLIELSSQHNSDPNVYCDLAHLEPMLAGRILGTANSCWASPLRPVTQIEHAINMIGVENIRALALAFCLERFHASMELDGHTTRLLWEAALLKAITAKMLAEAVRPDWSEEAFVAGLLQDLGVPLMLSISDDYREMLLNPVTSIEELLKFEKQFFGVDHTTVGSVIAYRLGLPMRYLTSILRHHSQPVHKTDDPDISAEWIDGIVGLLPHAGQVWNMGGLQEIDGILKKFWSHRWPDLTVFLQAVTECFTQLAGKLGYDVNKMESAEELYDRLAKANAQAVSRLTQQVSRGNSTV